MKRTTSILVVSILCVAFAHATEFSGRINRYAAVLSIDSCRNTVRIASVTWLQKGDRVVLMQMKGARVDTSESASAGSITDIGSAGWWEWCTVDTVMGGYVRLMHRLLNRYSAADGAQLIKVARARSADVVGPISGQSWNGTTGGVIAIECDDTLTLRSSILARGIGYRGGAVSVNTRDTSVTLWTSRDDAGLGGRKGEGCLAVPRSRGAGRSPWANGGGGGNARNGGGGGGGNGGEGGMGGSQPSDVSVAPVNGVGGVALASFAGNRLFLGGGGGGGHQNDFKGSGGALGGGIILINATVLIAVDSIVLDASGANATDALEDGAGGGGAGGSICLAVTSLVGAVVCTAEGGNGGENNGIGNCYAPGGGGGGGVVMSTIPVVASVRGGTPGFAQDVACMDDVHHGATVGADGKVLTTSGPPASTVLYIAPKISTPDTIVCARMRTYVKAEGGANYEWWVNDTLMNTSAPALDFIPQKRRNQVICAIMTDGGCVFYDTIRVDTTSCAEPTSDVGFRIDDVRGRPGDSVEIILHLSTRDSIRYQSTIRFRLVTRASVLVPAHVLTDSTQLVRAWRWTWMQVPTYNGMTDTLIRIPMVLTLGDDERSTITIDSFAVDDGRVLPRLGRFGICSLEVCTDGGIRLFDANSGTTIQRHPTSITIESATSQSVTACAFDVVGRQYPATIMTRSPCVLRLSELVDQHSSSIGWIVLTVGDRTMILPWQHLN
ncbi:hypothetical protein BH10BAC6_BH10BAC6_13840 [soil metagenome]